MTEKPAGNDDKRPIPVLLDREISSNRADAFGHRHFANMLKGLIESDEIQPPFTIGLLGNWGSGKSSIKSMYESSLTDDASSESRNERFHPVTFNAWRFGGEQIKRALLRHVYLELGGNKNKLDDALFRQVQDTIQSKKDWKTFGFELFDRWGWNIILLLSLYIITLGALAAAVSVFGIDNKIIVAILSGGALLSPLPLAKWLLDSGRISRFANITRITAPSSTAEEYEDLLLEQLSAFKNQLGKRCERLIIFVDDLDRLASNEMIDGLDAIRTFMEIPKSVLPEGLGIIFVISCDEDRFAEALARRNNGAPEQHSTVYYQNDARRYLDRIFQFRIDIPPFPKQDMRAFAQEKLISTLPNIVNELASLDTSIEALIDRMIHVQVQTPRNALQILNAFIQCWWVAQHKENDGTGSDRPGGLQVGSVTGHPIALGAICSLRVDFADFYADLQREPKLIEHFTDVFIRDVALTEKPDQVRPILEKYAEPNGLLAPKFRALRQFVASLQWVIWPQSLQPLLTLSQDPVTRKFGDGALQLYDSFVSGDKHGVLTELGRHNDNKPLSEEHMRLLRDMVEELERETASRQNNAAFVLAELSDRYSNETAHLLLTPLARRLAKSKELRWRIGVSNIKGVIERAVGDDKTGIACRLIEDLLVIEGEINFRLPSGEQPSLTESLSMCREACTMVLDVRSQTELPNASEERLLDWLLARNVSTDDKDDTLSFEELETWMAVHESWLLPALGNL
jgi:hypothetical protein